MKRILFVDDEPAVLEGLRNVLRKYRKQWDLHFALGGEEALGKLAQQSFDVVVSDMRMPGIDGAALLEKVKELYPETLRLILSGHADQKDMVRAVAVAHQFLSKPCNAETLPAVIQGADEIRSYISDETLRRLVGKIDKLPMPPRLYWQLTAAMSGADASMAKVSALVEQDPAMCARMLQFVNSAFFGMGRRIANVQQAATLLGFETIRSLVLTVHVVETLDRLTPPDFSYGRLQSHSLEVAKMARTLGGATPIAQQAFTAGILHDLGKVIIAVTFPDRYREISEESSTSGLLWDACERQVLGFSHAEIGAYLLGLWGLPQQLIECVAYHHDPAKKPENAVLQLLAEAHRQVEDGEAAKCLSM